MRKKSRSSYAGRDIVLQNSSSIRKAGNDGKPYFLNEDTSDSYRRWKADLQKYIKHLEYRKHLVVKSGDNLIIDGVKYRPEEFNTLPEGDRLCDSRTVFRFGVVAFNSIHSPLSNLYPCRVKHQGCQFNSVEQGYQYLKAKFHNKHKLAADLLKISNPYDIVAEAKGEADSREWEECRINIMSRLLLEKADQCPEFKALLKKTNNHRLVENTLNPVWGSGCPFLHAAVWDGTYKGRNLLGHLLEEIRGRI